MSSPIAIPRVAATASGAASSMSTSPTGLYVPVHKRRDASHSPASSRCSSPALSTSPSWRTHTPSKEPTAAFRKQRKTPSNASSTHTASTTTHIPKHNMIPQHALPHTYSIHTLLALSSHPAPLSQHQHDTLRSLAAAIAPRDVSDKPAPRRRRTGRKAKNASPKIAIQTADVEMRRRRHAHGTWGWQPYASSDALSHQQELEESWRHAAPVTVAVDNLPRLF